MAEIRLEGLHKKYGDIVALDGISFDVKDREFVVMLGPTGAGKTTTLRSIVGLEKPEQGEIFLNNEKINDLPPGQRNMAFVSQHYALYPNLSVYKNLEFPLNKLMMTGEQKKNRIQEIAVRLHIEHLLERKPEKLSGGEMQRVVIGRAMVRDPQIFLFDEPLSNLDAKLREELRYELKRLQRELGNTVLMVTHDQVEALSMADRIVVLYKGKIQQIDTPQDVYSWPANVLVSSFVGSPGMNLIDVTVMDGMMVNKTNKLSVSTPPGYKGMLKPGDYKLGIRAEDVGLTAESTKGAWPADVYMYEALGDEKLVELNIGANRIKARFSPRTPVKIGEKVWVAFNEKRLRFFDQDGQLVKKEP
jgi:multiple sugar transport system ATP-binding protein